MVASDAPGVALPPLVVEVVDRFFDFFLVVLAAAAVFVFGVEVDVACVAEESSARVVVVPTLTFSLPLEQAPASMISAIAPQPKMLVRTRRVVTFGAYARASLGAEGLGGSDPGGRVGGPGREGVASAIAAGTMSKTTTAASGATYTTGNMSAHQRQTWRPVTIPSGKSIRKAVQPV